jgi:type IX secretion system substrate protein
MKYRKTYMIAMLILMCSGIAQAQIVFTEDFEEATLESMSANWTEVKNLEGMEFSNDVPPGSTGKQSLMMTAVIGENTGGHLYKMFPDGFEELYARFYVKFSATHDPVHHFVHMGGYNPPTRWPQGGAGERPVGNERFTSGIEPFGSNWRWDFYSYWMHMRGNPVPNRYWGNNFRPEPPAPVTRGTWQCIEVMMKCNSPLTSSNGEQAFWVDGKKVLHLKQGEPKGYWVWDSFHQHPDSSGFEGFQWRSDPNLNVNFFWLLYYMTAGPQGQKDSVWFDDITVSTKYNGPVTKVEHPLTLPYKLSISAYPNPARGEVRIEYKTPPQSYSRIRIYDALGRIVKSNTIDPGSRETGTVLWNPHGLPPGLYIAELSYNGAFANTLIMYLNE